MAEQSVEAWDELARRSASWFAFSVKLFTP